MPLSTYHIQRIVQDLDPNHDPANTTVACMVVDITLNQIYDPMRLDIRHKCGYGVAYNVVTELINHHMTAPDWICDTDIETSISFWLRVLVAQGKLTTKPTHVLQPFAFGPIIKEARYITI